MWVFTPKHTRKWKWVAHTKTSTCKQKKHKHASQRIHAHKDKHTHTSTRTSTQAYKHTHKHTHKHTSTRTSTHKHTQQAQANAQTHANINWSIHTSGAHWPSTSIHRKLHRRRICTDGMLVCVRVCMVQAPWPGWCTRHTIVNENRRAAESWVTCYALRNRIFVNN